MIRTNDNLDWTPLTAALEQEHQSEAGGVPADPVSFATSCLDFSPDPIQGSILRSQARRIILCMGRRAGKTFTVSTRALHFALTHPGSETLIFSRSQRQANILLWNIRRFLSRLEIRRSGDGMNPDSLLLPNGARILSLPPESDNILGFTPDLLILDEAARIPDALYFAVSPMLALNNPTLILLSTPNGRRGFFYREWASSRNWERFFAPSEQCPRISPGFLEEQRQSLPEIIFRQEYGCEFLDSSGAYFPEALLERAIDRSLDPFYTATSAPTSQTLNSYPRETIARDFYLGLDIGQAQDYTAITVVESLRLVSTVRDPLYLTFPESWQHRVRHMQRLPLQTPFHQVVDQVVELIGKLRGATRIRNIELVVDATAVGSPIVEMLRNARPQCVITPITITGADHVSTYGDTQRVPKRDLMSRLHLMLEDDAIRIPHTLPALEDFREEFRAFRLRFTSKGHDTYSAEGQTHDDLLLSLALATWRCFK